MSKNGTEPTEHRKEAAKDGKHGEGRKKHPVKSKSHTLISVEKGGSYIVPVYVHGTDGGFVRSIGEDINLTVSLHKTSNGAVVNTTKVELSSAKIRNALESSKSHTYVHKIAGHKFRVTVHRHANPGQYSWQIHVSKKSGERSKEEKHRKKEHKGEDLKTQRGKIAAYRLAINGMKPEPRHETTAHPPPTQNDLKNLEKQFFDDVLKRNAKGKTEPDNVLADAEASIQKEMGKKLWRAWAEEYAYRVVERKLEEEEAKKEFLLELWTQEQKLDPNFLPTADLEKYAETEFEKQLRVKKDAKEHRKDAKEQDKGAQNHYKHHHKDHHHHHHSKHTSVETGNASPTTLQRKKDLSTEDKKAATQYTRSDVVARPVRKI